VALKNLQLKKSQERRLQVGHLWVYSNEVDVAKSPLKSFEPGELVNVVRVDGKSMGTAYINPNTLISARIIDDEPNVTPDAAWFERRILDALALRSQYYQQNCYRLIHSEGDYLPGVIIDRYGDYLVLQINTQGMMAFRDTLVEVLQKVFQPKGILLRNDNSARIHEGLEAESEWLLGQGESTIIIENETRFEIPLGEGQKTGWFYDHRENRRSLQRIARDKHVLDVFSYMGGWGIAAAQAGAKSVCCVDSSTTAIAYVHKNAELNNVQDRVETVCDDAFDALKKLKAENRRFDIVVVDPPAFIKRKKDKEAGEKAYQQLNNLAMDLIVPGGMLISASCSHHLEEESLQRIILRAARRQRRRLQILSRGDQAPDHPVHPAIAETRYIKTIFCRVI